MSYTFIKSLLYIIVLSLSFNLHANQYDQLVGELDFPNSFSYNDEYIFISEHQSGFIKKFDLKTFKNEIVIDLSGKINVDNWESGINSIALSPTFEKDNLLFVKVPNVTDCRSLYSSMTAANPLLNGL